MYSSQRINSVTCLRFSSRCTLAQSGSATRRWPCLAAPAGVESAASSAPSLMSSGKGQDSPAVSVRFNVSRTVERAMPSRRAISCVDTQENFSRIISRAWRTVIRSAGTDRSLGLPKGDLIRPTAAPANP